MYVCVCGTRRDRRESVGGVERRRRRYRVFVPPSIELAGLGVVVVYTVGWVSELEWGSSCCHGDSRLFVPPLFARSLVRSFARLGGGTSCVHSFARGASSSPHHTHTATVWWWWWWWWRRCSCVRSFVCSCVRSFVSCVRVFAVRRSLVRVFARSLVRSPRSPPSLHIHVFLSIYLYIYIYIFIFQIGRHIPTAVYIYIYVLYTMCISIYMYMYICIYILYLYLGRHIPGYVAMCVCVWLCVCVTSAGRRYEKHPPPPLASPLHTALA